MVVAWIDSFVAMAASVVLVYSAALFGFVVAAVVAVTGSVMGLVVKKRSDSFEYLILLRFSWELWLFY